MLLVLINGMIKKKMILHILFCDTLSIYSCIFNSSKHSNGKHFQNRIHIISVSTPVNSIKNKFSNSQTIFTLIEEFCE